MTMKLINSKSILDCDENEEEVHNQENNEFIEKLFDSHDYECAAPFKAIITSSIVSRLVTCDLFAFVGTKDLGLVIFIVWSMFKISFIIAVLYNPFHN